MNPSIVLLIVLLAPLVGAIISFACYTKQRWAISTAIFSSIVTLVASVLLGILTKGGSVYSVHAGSWKAPFGIVVVADAFSAIMLIVCQIVILASLIFSIKSLNQHYQRRHLYPLIMTLSFGANGAFLTGDLFNLYVWFEVLLLSSFAIIAMVRGRKGESAAWKYVVMNLIASLLFLSAAGLIYGKTGTLNFAELHLRFSETDSSFLINSSSALLFGAFGIKSALIPLAFWLPTAYPKLPSALSALFAGLLTKVGLYAFYRVFGMVFSDGSSFPHQNVLFTIAIITMVGGVLGAVGQNSMRRILSFHIISQVGYMALALALFSPLAMAAGIFYLAHHIIVKANLFLTTGLVEKHSNSSELSKTQGILKSSPIIALLFAIPALSLAGLPPLSGFFAKFSLLKSAASIQDWIAIGAIVFVGVLTIFSMLKIWNAIFWGESSESKTSLPKHLLHTSTVLGIITILIGVFAGPLFEYAETAADSLLNPKPYLESVLSNQS